MTLWMLCVGKPTSQKSYDWYVAGIYRSLDEAEEARDRDFGLDNWRQFAFWEIKVVPANP